MNISNIGFSSKEVLIEPFEWVYELEDIGFTGWEMVQEGEQRLTPANVDKVEQVLETTDLTLTVHLPFSDMNLAGLNEGIHAEVLRQMEEYLKLAGGLTKLAVVHPGYLSPYGSKVPDLAWKTNIRSIQRLCDVADEHGIFIAVENMPDFRKIFGRYPQEMLDIISEVDRDNVGMTLDVGHANTMGLLPEFLDLCKDHIIHVHLHDNMGKRDEHLPVGRGNIDWKIVIEGLKDFKGRCVTEMSSLEQGRECLDFFRNV